MLAWTTVDIFCTTVAHIADLTDVGVVGVHILCRGVRWDARNFLVVHLPNPALGRVRT